MPDACAEHLHFVERGACILCGLDANAAQQDEAFARAEACAEELEEM